MLGDCWFLSAASSLAEYPERIEKIFTNSDYSAEGIFRVELFRNGEPFYEVVDDRLPMYWGQPINSNAGLSGSFWLVILEKAYAKMNVNYANLNGGMPDQAFRDLTGMPTLFYWTEEQTDEDFYDLVALYDEKKYSMAAGCQNEGFGLITGHAYSILGAVTLYDGGSEYQKLVKMRNPWAVESYNGDWNDSDWRWTDDFKEQAGMVAADDGVFFMPYDDFDVTFTTWQVLLYQDWHKDAKHVTG